MMNLNPNDIKEKIDQKVVTLTVVGLGKMGLPIAMVFTNAGFKVKGYDISLPLIENLNLGRTDLIGESGVSERLTKALNLGLFKATSDMEEAFRETDIIIIIIPILDNDEGAQELKVLKQLYTEIAKTCETDTLFIQESTLAPGTTKNEIWPILKANKKKEIKFGLVFAPERTLSGRAIKDIEENYPKLIGGVNTEDTEAASYLYQKIAKKGVIKLSNATTAEAVKTFKGAYRDANIALANQFAIMADLFGVDVLEVIDAANTEPYSHIHRPGIGVGGHCIPVYPKFLIHNSDKMGYQADLLIESRETNDYMVDYAIKILEENNHKMKEVLILGLAYRNAVKEYRNSPTLRLVPKLRAKNYNVTVTDPLFTSKEIDTLFGDETGIDFNENYEKYDTVIVNTDHSEFSELNDKLVHKVIFDGRYIINKNIEGIKLFQPGRLISSNI